MIISVSRRTDLPAFHAAWFAERLRAGYCLVPNPYNARQISRISLAPSDVDAFVFWTRHIEPLIPTLRTLQERQTPICVHYTLTGYPRALEPRTPPPEKALPTLRSVSALLPRGAVIWRYDPILLSTALPARFHIENFARLAAYLEGAVEQVAVSLITPYQKTQRALAKLAGYTDVAFLEQGNSPEIIDLLGTMATQARRHGITMQACAQPHDYRAIGISSAKCIDGELLTRLYGGLWPTRKDPGQRPLCSCIPSRDIGVANTCLFGCTYCYATRSLKLSEQRCQARAAGSESLADLGPTFPAAVPTAAISKM